MKRKKQLYEEMKQLVHEIKGLDAIVKYNDSTPTEDEIHGWAIKMDILTKSLEQLKEEVIEFYKN